MSETFVETVCSNNIRKKTAANEKVNVDIPAHTTG